MLAASRSSDTAELARRLSVKTLLLVAGVGLVVAGCGSDTARSAAEEEALVTLTNQVEADADAVDDAADDAADTDTDTDASDPDADDTAPEPEPASPAEPAAPNNLFERVTSGGNKGSRFCIRNEISTPANNTFSVQFTKSDTSNGGELAPGDTRCGEGTFFVGYDVMGEMKFPNDDIKTVPFAASNPWAGKPNAYAQFAGSSRRASDSCNAGYRQNSDLDEGQFTTCANLEREVQLWRLNDTAWKEWLLIVKERDCTDPNAPCS